LTGVVGLLLLFAGELIVTIGATPRLTVIVAVLPVPNEFEQTTLITFGPITSGNVVPPGVVFGEPLSVQVVPAGIVLPPFTVYVTFTEVDVVLRLLTGLVIAAAGVLPEVTCTTAGTEAPKALLQITVIVLPPLTRLTVVPAGVVLLAPLTVQPADGTVVVPSIEYTRFVVVAAVVLLSAGALIATTGTLPRMTVTGADPLPNVFEQATVMLLVPSDNATGLVTPLAELVAPTLQVVPPGIVVEPLTV